MQMIENKQQRPMLIATIFDVFLAGNFGTARRKGAKQEINGKPAGDQDQSRQSRRSAIAQQDDENYAGANNVKRRHDGITDRLVRTFRQRLRAAQAKNSDDRQNVKNQNGGN